MTQRKLKNGPGKFDLMVALFAKDETNPAFEIEGMGPLRLDVQSVALEDGSHESWLISGYTAPGYRRFKAYFNTRSRQGSISIDQDDIKCDRCHNVMEVLGHCKHCDPVTPLHIPDSGLRKVIDGLAAQRKS